jgi:hypothetical protein
VRTNRGGGVEAIAPLTATRIVVAALALGVVMFAGLAFFVVSIGIFTPLPLPPGARLAFGTVSIVIVLAGLALRARLLADVEADTEDGVLNRYRTGLVAGSAVIEGGGIFGGVGALLTGSANLALVAGAVAVVAILSGLRSSGSLDRALRRLPH